MQVFLYTNDNYLYVWQVISSLMTGKTILFAIAIVI